MQVFSKIGRISRLKSTSVVAAGGSLDSSCRISASVTWAEVSRNRFGTNAAASISAAPAFSVVNGMWRILVEHVGVDVGAVHGGVTTGGPAGAALDEVGVR